jgi:hypothetical protein
MKLVKHVVVCEVCNPPLPPLVNACVCPPPPYPPPCCDNAPPPPFIYLFIVSLLIVIFAVDCDISPSLPLSESSEQSLLLPVDIVLPLVFAHRCCFKPPLALDDPVNGWLL